MAPLLDRGGATTVLGHSKHMKNRTLTLCILCLVVPFVLALGGCATEKPEGQSSTVQPQKEELIKGDNPNRGTSTPTPVSSE